MEPCLFDVGFKFDALIQVEACEYNARPFVPLCLQNEETNITATINRSVLWDFLRMFLNNTA